MRLHLVDGTFELYRAHYSKRPEQPFKASIGLAQSLLGLLKDPAEQVTHLAIAFDNPIRSFRNDLFAGYKTDDGVPPELREQFDLAEEGARAVGAVVWSMKEFEADDALATAAARWRDQVDQVRILTPDKDLGQCLEGDRVVQIDVIRKRKLDESSLLARRGVKPRSVPDYLALTGDDADGIPGLPGFGERTAAALLSKYLHLDAVPLDGRQWPPSVRSADRLAATLRERLPDALLYRKLATLVTDVPLPQRSLEELRFQGVSAGRLASFNARTGATLAW
ncbi:MAG: 5'-3' exonuclease H3TH domain-containing protein [Myxococcales bacterium]|nr:flap endonuclease [Myxococcales bacterium]